MDSESLVSVSVSFFSLITLYSLTAPVFFPPQSLESTRRMLQMAEEVRLGQITTVTANNKKHNMSHLPCSCVFAKQKVGPCWFVIGPCLNEDLGNLISIYDDFRDLMHSLLRNNVVFEPLKLDL